MTRNKRYEGENHGTHLDGNGYPIGEQLGRSPRTADEAKRREIATLQIEQRVEVVSSGTVLGVLVREEVEAGRITPDSTDIVTRVQADKRLMRKGMAHAVKRAVTSEEE